MFGRKIWLGGASAMALGIRMLSTTHIVQDGVSMMIHWNRTREIDGFTGTWHGVALELFYGLGISL